MKNAVIYYTFENVVETGITAKVTLNGVEQKMVSRAKSGKNGFVEVPRWPLDSCLTRFYCRKYGEVPLKRIRGNVKIKFKV